MNVLFLFFLVVNFGFCFFQGTILSSTRPGEKPKLGGRYLGSGRAETQNRVGYSLVSRTGSIRWTVLGFGQRTGQRTEAITPVRLSLLSLRLCICVLLQYRDEEDAEEEEEISLLLLCALQGSHSVRRTDSLLRLQLTGDFIVLLLDPEAEPTRREDLRWDKEVCLFCVPLLLLLLHCVENVLQELQTRGLSGGLSVCLSVCHNTHSLRQTKEQEVGLHASHNRFSSFLLRFCLFVCLFVFFWKYFLVCFCFLLVPPVTDLPDDRQVRRCCCSCGILLLLFQTVVCVCFCFF